MSFLQILFFTLVLLGTVAAGIAVAPHILGPKTSRSTTAPTNIIQQEFSWTHLSSIRDPAFTSQNNQIYFQGAPFSDTDPSTFMVSTFRYGTSSTAFTAYAKDKNHVYFYYMEDPISRQYGVPEYFVETISIADPETFEPLYNSGELRIDSSNYAKDKNHVYDRDRVIVGADPRTFELVFGTPCATGTYPYPSSNAGCPPTDFSKDSKHVFFFDIGVPNLDSATFQYLGDGRYVKDRYHVYSLFNQDGTVAARPVMLSSADPGTFTVLDPSIVMPGDCGLGFPANCEYDAKDKNNFYYAGQLAR